MSIRIGDVIKRKDDLNEYLVTDLIATDAFKVTNKLGMVKVIQKDEIILVKRPDEYRTIFEKKEILDKKEKDYLRAVIRPFREKINSISKCGYNCYNQQYIIIKYDEGEEIIRLPDFLKGTMYKGMELDREYTLEELGL